MFTLEQEKQLYEDIKNNYIDKNRPLTNDIIKEIAFKKIREIDENKIFNMSNGWTIMFKKRWNLSTQKVKCSKIATNIPTNDDIQIFLDEYHNMCKDVKKRIPLIMMKLRMIL